MLYLDEVDLKKMENGWLDTVAVIRSVVKVIGQNDFSQPIKPYLRFRNQKNRIISMPAFVGGKIRAAGIKWISSFPENGRLHSLPRAHSIVVLNNVDNGVPVCIINSALLSVIRTASVSGLVIEHCAKFRDMQGFVITIMGFGPIGQSHLKMCTALLQGQISKIFIHDPQGVDLSNFTHLDHSLLEVVTDWRSSYSQSDIFITCTVAENPYIYDRPKRGSLHLNVSLRDYTLAACNYFKNSIVVDSWEEVCRENTDVENMYKAGMLSEDKSYSLVEVIELNRLESIKTDDPIMFNPMGMGVFDVAIGKYFMDKAIVEKVGKHI